jgi:hypothetical protein
LAAGDYSYSERFSPTTEAELKTVILGPCEPFKVVDPTPTPTTSLPKTGDNVGGIAITGAVLLVAGAGMIGFLFIARRRRSAAEANN